MLGMIDTKGEETRGRKIRLKDRRKEDIGKVAVRGKDRINVRRRKQIGKKEGEREREEEEGEIERENGKGREKGKGCGTIQCGMPHFLLSSEAG